MDITLSPQHSKNLAMIMDFVGFDSVPVVEMNEAKAELTQMTSDEIANASYQNKPIVVRVDDAIIQSIPKLIKEFKESKYWYNQFNDGVTKTLGSSEGSFFLALMAAFSAQTGLEQNLALTVRAYHALTSDAKQNKSLLLSYLDMLDNMPPAQQKNIKKAVQDIDAQNPDNKYRNLGYHKFIAVYGKTSNQIIGANAITRYYLEHNNHIDRDALVKAISSAIERSGDIKKDRLLGGFKILNFALNLLSPAHKVDDIGWLPVTIDSWMIYFFYPQIYEMEKLDKEKAKSQIFGGYKKYTYLAKIVQEQAHKFNMEPHQLQALLWISSIRKYRPNASTKDIHATLQYMINEFNSEQDDLEKMAGFLNNLNAAIK